MENLSELFEATLQDVYFAENALVKALPKMAGKVQSVELKECLTDHLEETKNHVARLQKVFTIIGPKAKSKECKAIQGLLGEADEVMSEASGEALDAGAIGYAQTVEHYEIARYGTLKAWAEQLGLADAVDLLEATLEEEKAADGKLSDIALGDINAEAAGDDNKLASSRSSAKPSASPQR